MARNHIFRLKYTQKNDFDQKNALIKATWPRFALLKIIVKIDRSCREKFYVAVKMKKFGTLHEFACHPRCGQANFLC